MSFEFGCKNVRFKPESGCPGFAPYILDKAAIKGDAYAIARAGVTNTNWNVGILGSPAWNIGRKMFEEVADCTCQK